MKSNVFILLGLAILFFLWFRYFNSPNDKLINQYELSILEFEDKVDSLEKENRDLFRKNIIIRKNIAILSREKEKEHVELDRIKKMYYADSTSLNRADFSAIDSVFTSVR